MNFKKQFYFSKYAALLGAILVYIHCAIQALSSDAGLAREFSPIALRGYGTLSGYYRELGNGNSVLEIECEDPVKAKLTQAKYLSDLSLSPGVKTETAKEPLIYTIDGQGCIAAYCESNKVRILAAKSETDLRALIQQINPSGSTAPQVEVPMYLDRWDRFSFRFYGRPWDRPSDTTDATYDFTSEFDYAKEHNRIGFLFADALFTVDSAQGMLNYGWWKWAADETRKRGLPFDLHLAGHASSEPTWLLNAYRDQTQQKMPGFTGNVHGLMSPIAGGQGILSWNSSSGEDARLGILQESVRDFSSYPNLVSFLEPHGELKHGPQDILMEYGPLADAAYRKFLKGKYDTIDKLSERWATPLKSWEEVHIPQLVSFAGWNSDSIDIGRFWRVGYESLLEPAPSPYNFSNLSIPKSTPAPAEWFQSNFDDSKWPEIPGAGSDYQIFLPKSPAVFRCHFDVPPSWKTNHTRIWLYLWDMNLVKGEEVRLVLNDKEIGRSKISRIIPHWCAFDVTQELNEGKNTLAVRVPQGYIAYKTYLSSIEPKQYPNLGEGLNAQWVDFIDYTQSSRIDTVRRGMEMIRQVAPNQGITLMAPDAYADGIKSLAVRYGGEFRNTGYMGAFWADYLPSLMRGADLPFSIEPGSPAKDIVDFKRQMGRYQTEGVQSIDYFLRPGDILWRSDIKAEFESHLKQIEMLGQTHYPKAELAFLYSDRIAQLTGYPWGLSPNTIMGASYFYWNGASVLRGLFPYDALSQSSFTNGEANAYRIIIDTNTSIMDDAMIDSIEKWIRNGGVFVTFAQTGRHSPEKSDAWPISRLTGYKTIKIDQLDLSGNAIENGTIRPAPDQSIFDNRWQNIKANGLHLAKVANDAKDILLWNDGSVAAGYRNLGKGYIVELGVKFSGDKIRDRIEPGVGDIESEYLRQMFLGILKWQNVSPEPGRLVEDNDFVILRHSVTNNGLYDVWTLWNQSQSESQTVSMKLEKVLSPLFYIDAANLEKKSINGSKIEGILLKPLDTRVFLTPHQDVAQASVAWFDLQRKWWRGVEKPASKILPKPDRRFSFDLTQDWKFRLIDNGSSAAELLANDFDDTSWTTRSLGVWNVKEADNKGRGVFRKTFTVPSQWVGGTVSLWMTSWVSGSFVEKGRVWLDGKEVKPLDSGAYIGIGLPEFIAGSVHKLAIEVVSGGALAGFRGQCWLSFEPSTQDKINLMGEWMPSTDGLSYDQPIALPGRFNAQFLKRTFFVEDKYKGKNAVLTIDGDATLVSVLINGKLVRRHHHMVGTRASLNLTPYVRFNADNEIILVRWNKSGPGVVRDVFMGFFDPKVYP